MTVLYKTSDKILNSSCFSITSSPIYCNMHKHATTVTVYITIRRLKYTSATLNYKSVEEQYKERYDNARMIPGLIEILQGIFAFDYRIIWHILVIRRSSFFIFWFRSLYMLWRAINSSTIYLSFPWVNDILNHMASWSTGKGNKLSICNNNVTDWRLRRTDFQINLSNVM